MNIIGRITADAQVHTLKDEREVVNFSVAVNDSYKNKQGERVQLTEYFSCAYWRSANVAKILTKGSLVELTGRVSTNAWMGRDGEIRSGLNFHTSNIKLHGGGAKSVTDDKPNSKPQKSEVSPKETDGDLPF